MEETQIDEVLLDGSVLLKIIKHCEEEALAGQSQVHGYLYGLAKGNCLEITHCLPSLPSPNDANLSPDEQAALTAIHDQNSQIFENDIIKHIRQVNIDYLNVGYYISALRSCFYTRDSLEGLYTQQNIMSESVMLVYDPSKVSRGQIQISAYRINPRLRDVMKEILREEEKSVKVGQETFRKARLRYGELFVSVPVHVRNSHLANVLLADVGNRLARTDGMGHAGSPWAGLSLSVASSMEHQLKDILTNLEDLQMDLSKHIQMQRFLNKNNADQRHPQLHSRIDSALLAAQIQHFCNECQTLSEQSLHKLKISKIIQEGKSFQTAASTAPLSSIGGSAYSTE